MGIFNCHKLVRYNGDRADEVTVVMGTVAKITVASIDRLQVSLKGDSGLQIVPLPAGHIIGGAIWRISKVYGSF